MDDPPGDDQLGHVHRGHVLAFAGDRDRPDMGLLLDRLLEPADHVSTELAVEDEWEPLGAIAIGYPTTATGPRDPASTDGLLIER